MTDTLRKGFSIAELLTMLAAVGVLAALLVPLVERVRADAARAGCAANLRHLSLAMLNYADDNLGWLPAGASAGDPRPEDWIYWQGTEPRGRQHPYGDSIEDSALAPYVAGGMADESVLFCPGDRLLERLPDHPYPYSYMMNTWAGRYRVVVLSSPMAGYVPRFPNPSEFIMLIEEGHSVEREFYGDIPYAFGNSWRNDGVLRPDGRSKLAARHGGRGNVSFIDGHVRLVTPEFVRDPANSRLGFY